VNVKKHKYPLVTIVSLFSGRFGCLSHYLYGLENLDYPKDRLRIVWYCGGHEAFFNTLELCGKALEGYDDVQVYYDDTIPMSPLAFSEIKPKDSEEARITGYILQLNTISAMYNAAWQYVDTDYVFSVEDDILLPTHTLKRFIGIMEIHPKAAEVIGSIQCRHFRNVIGLWDLREIPQLNKNGRIKMVKAIQPFSKPWGVQKIAGGNLGVTLFKRSRCPKVLKKKLPFRATVKHRNMNKPYGVDILVSLDIIKNKKEVYGDFETRPYHIDSQGKCG